MPVSDFECQIARGQIVRYLDGGALSSVALTGLEEHLAECPGCQDAVARRRAALLGALGNEAPTRAVVSLPTENPLVAALRAKAETEKAGPAAALKAEAAVKPRYAKPEPKSGLGKPLALAALLAAVLLGMSRLSHFATAPSSHADAGFAAQALPEPVAKLSVPASTAKAPAVAPAVLPEKPASAPESPTPDRRETPPAPKPIISAKNPAHGPRTLPGAVPKALPLKGENAKSTRHEGPQAVSAPVKPKLKVPAPKVKVSVRPPVVRPTKIHAIKRPAHRRAVRVLRRRAPVRRARAPRPRTTVRVYGLDGHLLKP